MNKFVSSDVPEHIIVWSLDCLNGRKQFVKVGESVSSTTAIGAGTPQDTGPNDFKLIINDLTFTASYVKYVDDTTVLSLSKNVNDDTLQTCADRRVHWTKNNGMLISTNMYYVILLSCGNSINRVTTFKL